MTILSKYKSRYENKVPQRLSIEEYLEHCKTDRSYYAGIHERMLLAIGSPTIIDTSTDERLSRIFSNRKIRIYESFKDFYGIETVIEQLVAFLEAAAKGLEESKNVLYFLGPVGSAKSSLAERLKELIQKIPFYTIEAFNKEMNKWEISPLYESPLGLFDKQDIGDIVPFRYLKYPMSPWAVKRLREAEGDLSQFKVVKMWPSILQQIGVTKVEPSDENNQDVSTLTGKVNIRKLDYLDEADPDAYSWVGGLNVSTQGVLDFVEMFKSPLKVLNPLLTALQEGHYNGTQQFGAIPYPGLVIAHSNQTEWSLFKNDKKNEAFLDRITIIKVPYCLRVSEEIEIYNKLIDNSELKTAPKAPGTLEALAQYSVLTRLKNPDNSNVYSKMEVYDGKNMKSKDPGAKPMEEYKDLAGIDEGMAGSSTRTAYKILSKTYAYDIDEVAANPIHLMLVLEKQIVQEQLPKEEEERRLTFINEVIKPRFFELLEKDIQQALLDNADDFMQNIFERYVVIADAWIQDKDYRDNDTGTMYDRAQLNAELEKIEKPAQIANPKEFRNEVVNFVLRAKANNGGKMISWNGYEKIKEVIERQVLNATQDLLPVISFSKKASDEEQFKHNSFLKRMEERGYTAKQIKILVDWYHRYKKHS